MEEVDIKGQWIEKGRGLWGTGVAGGRGRG